MKAILYNWHFNDGKKEIEIEKADDTFLWLQSSSTFGFPGNPAETFWDKEEYKLRGITGLFSKIAHYDLVKSEPFDMKKKEVIKES